MKFLVFVYKKIIQSASKSQSLVKLKGDETKRNGFLGYKHMKMKKIQEYPSKLPMRKTKRKEYKHGKGKLIKEKEKFDEKGKGNRQQNNRITNTKVVNKIIMEVV